MYKENNGITQLITGGYSLETKYGQKLLNITKCYLDVVFSGILSGDSKSIIFLCRKLCIQFNR